MLAGRKLLLADDSITIQKIVALTFADEGIEVVAVSNGVEAVEKLEEISPDVVLADVFMPYLTGYQVCEHIKQTENLRHIPVLLLVGSFEPFDEAEARRVGADDILTKPFQSIRTLVDKVGALLGRNTVADHVERVPVIAPEPAPTKESSGVSVAETEGEPVAQALSRSEQEANTRELPPPELSGPPEEPMTRAELEITTADTQPLSPEIREHIEQFSSGELRKAERVWEAETMHTNFDAKVNPEPAEGFGEALLDLSHLEPVVFHPDDDGILDIDFDSPAPDIIPSAAARVQAAVAGDSAMELPASVTAFAPGFVEDNFESFAPAEETVAREIQTAAPVFVASGYAHEERIPEVENSWMISDAAPAVAEQQTEGMAQPEVVTERSQPTELYTGEGAGGSTPAGPIRLEQLSPEVVDAIARRAVEQLSEKVVQEIAWEVVPHLAELMIKRMLEEHEARNK